MRSSAAFGPDPHPASERVAALGLDDLETLLASGELTSEELTRGLLDRIEALDGAGTAIALHAVIALAADAVPTAARRDAERAAGRSRGRLHGVPILVKDNIEAAGLPGTAGSLALAGRTVVADAPLVARLRDAGAVVMGATNLSEWANFRSPRSTSGWSAVGGLTGNPWALDRSAGGSSSGSGAAVAAGYAPVAIGTETNGSITCPAALNGVVGFKPTVGTVPTRGVVPISASQDSPGPLARSVRDAALVLEVLSGRTDLMAACASGSAAPLVVGVAAGWLSGDAETDACFARAVELIEPLVAEIRPADVPVTPDDVHHDQTAVLVGEFVDDLDAYLSARPGSGARSMADVVAFNLANADTELGFFDQHYLEQAVLSGGRRALAYTEARARNVAWARDVAVGPALGGGIDLLVAPAYRPAWKSDLAHGDLLVGGGAVCTPAAILGWPILTVPIGLVRGLPVAMAITGPPLSESLLVAVGSALEDALGGPFAQRQHPAWRPPARG
ncbi:MAG: amidase [Actinobacteria bacterium]|nr:amidase [Actinomycetota bacterium]